MVPVVFGETDMSFRVQNKVSFSASHKQLENSADRIQFPKVFCDLNFQLETPNRSICTSLH